MGIKFRMFIFPKDFYSQALSFMIFLQLQKKAKISISKETVVWKSAKLVPGKVMCTNYLSNIMSCLSHTVLLQVAKKVSFTA